MWYDQKRCSVLVPLAVYVKIVIFIKPSFNSLYLLSFLVVWLHTDSYLLLQIMVLVALTIAARTVHNTEEFYDSREWEGLFSDFIENTYSYTLQLPRITNMCTSCECRNQAHPPKCLLRPWEKEFGSKRIQGREYVATSCECRNQAHSLNAF